MDQLFQDDGTLTKTASYYKENIQSPKSFPHIAYIRVRTANKCVGVILSRRYILSTAMCLRSHKYISVKVKNKVHQKYVSQHATHVWLGDEPKRNASKEYRLDNIFAIESVLLHPNYTESEFYRNVGVARLARDIDFTPRRYPACLEMGSQQPSGARADELLVTSFDRIARKTPISSSSVCDEYYDMVHILHDEQFCAKVKDNCNYPSGSPIQRRHETMDKVSTVVGLASMRNNCKLGESQLVFARITFFMDWIIQQVVDSGK